MARNNTNWRNNQNWRNPPVAAIKRQPQKNKEPAHKPLQVEVDFEEAAEINDTLYKHQIVLSFDGRVKSTQAREWIEAYNQLHTSHSLCFCEALIHSLFVAVVYSAAPGSTVQRLIRDSPIKALGQYASVNIYSADFNPKSPIDFNQLLHFQITDGTLFIYSYLDSIFKQIGKIVPDTRAIAEGSDHHKITALLQTSLKDLPSEVILRYSLTNQLLIKIDHVKQVRCAKCFSFDHLVSVCRSVDKTQVIVRKRNTKEAAQQEETTPKRFKSNAEGDSSSPKREDHIRGVSRQRIRLLACQRSN
jgi:hypothetical protein